MREPEAICFAGDWHGNTRWAVSAIDAVRENNADTIVHVGDYGFTFEDEYVDAVESACADNDVNLYFVDGNHDLHEFLWALPADEDGFLVLSEHVRYIPRGHRWQWWGVKFMGLGGATSVDKDFRKPYVEWWPTEAITRFDARKAIYGDGADLIGGPLGDPVPVDVMVTHDAPTGVDIPGISMEEGIKYFPYHSLVTAEQHRELMRSIVDEVKPKLFVHGHYHKMYVFEDETTKYVGLNMDGHLDNLWIVRNVWDLIPDAD